MQYNMSIVTRLVNRLRHNRGYGVQSPAAFHFVMHVLRECRHPYYLYPLVNKASRLSGDYTAKHCRRLFRIANYLQPTDIIMLSAGKGAAACAIALARNNVPCLSIGDNANEEIAKILYKRTLYKELQGDTKQLLHKELEGNKGFGLLYIGNTPQYESFIEVALPAANKKSVIIVEGIRRDKKMKKWWQDIIADKRIIVSFDLYNTGILTFDTEYKKQHYTFLFK